MLDQALSWWARQMRDLLPPWVRELRGGGAALILHDDGNDGVGIVLRRRGRERRLGRMIPGMDVALPNRRRAPTILRVPGTQLLEREISLPLAAERDLARVLHYEMDRLTPFAPDAVFWAAQIIGRDYAAGHLTVRLTVIPRSRLQPLLDRLARAGLRPTMAEAVPPSGSPCRIALDSAAPLAGHAHRGMRAVLAGGAIGLVLAGAALPFAEQAAALAAWNARIAVLRPHAAEAATLRRRIAVRTADADAIPAESARLGNALQVIATLTAILPDDSHLTAFSLHRRQLVLTGESAAAARLIGALAASGRIGDPHFAAPVVRVGNGPSDQFSIRAEWRP